MTFRLFSPLTRRILIVNIFPLAILVIGILYSEGWRDGLIEADLEALETQAEIFAGALGQGAVAQRENGSQYMRPGAARLMLRRLTAPTRTRTLIFDARGMEIADSQFLAGHRGAVQVERLPDPGDEATEGTFFSRVYDAFLALLPEGNETPAFPESAPLDVSRLPVLS